MNAPWEMMAAFLASALVLAVLYPLAPRIGLMDHPGERRKVHRHAVPPIGGIAIFIGLVAGSLLAPRPTPAEFYGMGGAALLVVVGALDDRFGLGPKLRLLAQTLAALTLTLGAGVSLTSLGDLFGFGPIELGPFGVPFTVFAMVGIMNAFNMIDGIDGLAGGLAGIALLGLLILSPTVGAVEIMMLTTLAAMTPYLVCNLELFGVTKRKVFLGDAGSLLLGYLLVWALVDSAERPGGIEPVTALWLVAIPLMDTFAVMGRRMGRGRSPFSADRCHLHHLLSRMFGCTRKTLVLLLLCAAFLAGIGVLGRAQQVPGLTMFVWALAVFGFYLVFLRYVQRLHRLVMRRRRLVAEEVA